MSRTNIVSQGFSGGHYFVTFATRGGGAKRYQFTKAEGVAIEFGSDPRDMNGQEVPLSQGQGHLKDYAEYALDEAEGVGLTAEDAIAAAIL
jgi:hypothetical protein